MYIGEKMSIAIEILALELSKNMFNKDELQKLQNYKRLIYQGDKNAIDEVINIYGKNKKRM